jgi:hypothetical protein
MWRYFQPLSRGSATSGGNNVSSDTTVQGEAAEQPNVGRAFNPDDIVADPALRRQIEEYDSNAQDQVRRTYILKGQCQPKGLDFPHRQYGRGSRPFKGHHIAFIAFFLSNQERAINMNFSPKLGIVIGKMQLNGLETMLAVLIVSTPMLDCILMILITKDKALILSCLMLVVRLKNSIKSI